MKIKELLIKLDNYSDYIIWSISTIGLFGSLYFSEVKKLTPCLLCWWQRIFMYPIVVILSVGILLKDKKSVYYALPLSLIGMPVAFYQSLLQWGVIKETLLNCSLYGSVACAKVDFEWLHFITIPFMAFLAFTAINILIAGRIYLWRHQR